MYLSFFRTIYNLHQASPGSGSFAACPSISNISLVPVVSSTLLVPRTRVPEYPLPELLHFPEVSLLHSVRPPYWRLVLAGQLGQAPAMCPELDLHLESVCLEGLRCYHTSAEEKIPAQGFAKLASAWASSWQRMTQFVLH